MKHGNSMNAPMTRRGLLRAGVAAAGWFALGDADAADDALVAGIERSVLWNGRKSGPTWFHPRPCMIPGKDGPMVFMTMQGISGSDYFHPVNWTMSKDLGKTWSRPEPIPGLGRVPGPDGLENGVCDVVPQYHPPTGTVLAMGHNVYYKGGRLARPGNQRYPTYTVRSSSGDFTPRRKLEWDDPRGTALYTCGCGQRLIVGSGGILVPMSFVPLERKDRAVGTVLCSFDGKTLEVRKVTKRELRLPVGRGLLEPSLTRFGGRYYMTMRAEDGRGHVAASDDGIEWPRIQDWCWDDGTPLGMSTTQQHWITHSDGLFLAYTRKDRLNAKVFRWRAPLYIAQVDTDKLCLIRSTERVALPLIGDGVKNAKHVARMGNFHTMNASPAQSWVIVGECLPADGWKGDVRLARVKWAKVNGVAGM